MMISEVAPAGKQFADRAQTKTVADSLLQAFPGQRFEVQKGKLSPIFYIRVFGVDKKDITDHFAAHGIRPLPLAAEQSSLSGKYRANILSYDLDNVIVSIVVAGSGQQADSDAPGVSVSIKEFTPTTLGLAGQKYNRASLIKDARTAVIAKTTNRQQLQQILLQLIDVAAGARPQLDPELNQILSDRARNQLSVDFGEVLAPIVIAKGSDSIEFPAEGNFPLVDVVVGGNRYSVKSLTGSGTSFKSIQDLMDQYEETISQDKDQDKQELFALFKAYHPKSGGKNVDKLIKAASYIKIPEYQSLSKLLGSNFESWGQLQGLVQSKLVKGNTLADYKKFLTTVFPSLTAGSWGRPVGLPADGAYYMGTSKKTAPPNEKSAGYPSFRANPVKAATDILTYALGVGTLNTVVKGPNAAAYTDMMTNIVNQSPAFLGKLDITSDGRIESYSEPFNKLNFKFQYHAPSHMPGNNLPGFMIVY